MKALIVFARRPEAGKVKTRLTTVLTPEQAAELHEAFVLDVLDSFRTVDADVRLYLSGGASHDNSDFAPRGVDCFEQRGEDLGQRMQNAFIETFRAGYEKIAIVGTDHPTLPVSYINLSYTALQGTRSIAIGPSEDGGYYLLAMNDFFPELFVGMTYSHDSVFRQTVERAAVTGAFLTILPPWYDVDTPDDLQRLIRSLKDDSGAAERTRRALERFGML
jgi:uncharacterized protein